MQNLFPNNLMPNNLFLKKTFGILTKSPLLCGLIFYLIPIIQCKKEQLSFSMTPKDLVSFPHPMEVRTFSYTFPA